MNITHTVFHNLWAKYRNDVCSRKSTPPAISTITQWVSMVQTTGANRSFGPWSVRSTGPSLEFQELRTCSPVPPENKVVSSAAGNWLLHFVWNGGVLQMFPQFSFNDQTNLKIHTGNYNIILKLKLLLNVCFSSIVEQVRKF